MINVSAIIKTEMTCRDFQVGSQIVHAVRNVSLEIDEGTLTILKGRSGSGKTTLINLLGVIDKPTSGDVIIQGKRTCEMKDWEKDSMHRELFGFVFQSGALVPNMTVYENVELVLRFKKTPQKERRSRIEEAISRVGLIKKVNQYPEELSGGEMQRIGIARAIVSKPKVILADEPTSALDVATGLKIVKLLKDLTVIDGTTLILATHDPRLVPMADCVYNLRDGEIVNE